MNKMVRAVIDEYQSRLDLEKDVVMSFDRTAYLEQRDAFLLAVGPDTAQFLNILIKARRPEVILEVGTSYGYSTVWLAEAAQAVGGKVFTLELSAAKSAFAKGMAYKAGLADSVEFIIGDALVEITKLAHPIDFALIDLWKELYIPVFDRVYPKLSNRAVVAADNILLPAMHSEAASKYVAHVRSQTGIESVTVPIGSGIELSCFSESERQR